MFFPGDGEQLLQDLTIFFSGDLNPVASKAQKKVPVPDGLDLDAWINEPVVSESEDSEEDQEETAEVCIKATGFGETFDLSKHPQGTEVKAITYSAMQINENPNFAEVFVIIDI